MNYFEILSIDLAFDIDLKKLEDNYIKLQAIFHPDKYINKPNANIAKDKSTLINNPKYKFQRWATYQ